MGASTKMKRFILPVASRYAAVLIQFGLTAAITNSLTVRDAGKYFLLLAFIQTTTVCAGIGIPDGLVREAPRVADREGAPRLILNRVLTASALTALMSILLACLLMMVGTPAWLAALAGAWWLANALVYVAAQSLVALGASSLGTGVFYNATNIGSAVGVLPLLAVTRAPDLRGVLIATVVGSGVAALLCCLLVARYTGPRSVARGYPELGSKRLALIGMPLAANRLVQAFTMWAPVWVVGLFLGPAHAASFGLATRLVSAVAAVIAAIRFSIRPELSRAAARGDWLAIERQGQTVARMATGLSGLALLLDLLLGPSVIGMLFGPQYDGTWMIVAILLIGTIGESAGGPVDEVLKMSGRGLFVLMVQAVAALVGLSLEALSTLAGDLYVAGSYALVFVAVYAVFVVTLQRTRGILVLPLRPSK